MEALSIDALWACNRTEYEASCRRTAELDRRADADRSIRGWISRKLDAEEEELCEAVRSKCLPTLERLRAAGYDFRTGPGSALALASRKKDPRFLRAILKDFTCHNIQPDALVAACEAGRHTNAKMLLDVQSTPMMGGALSAAVGGGNRRCVRLLLKYKRFFDEYETKGILHSAIAMSHFHCLKELLEHDIGDDPKSHHTGSASVPNAMILTVVKCNFEAIKLLSAYGAPREQRNVRDGRQSAEAAATRSPKLLKWLQKTRTWTRLHHVEQLSERHARKLLRGGADVFAKDAAGMTPIDRAEDVLAGDADHGKAAARLLLRAAQPWSEATHDLFPDAARRQAVDAIRLAYRLRKTSRFSLPMELWRGIILPHLVARM